MFKERNKAGLMRQSEYEEDIQSHPQRYQSTGNQHGSHVEPGNKTKKNNLESKSQILCNIYKIES